MRNTNYIFFLFAILVASSCNEEDAPTAKDHFMNYTIEEVPVTEDYVVGALYNSFTWDEDITETPQAGFYDAKAGEVAAYEQHVTWAETAGIDYFLFGLRSKKEKAEFNADTTYVSKLLGASNAGDVKFAFAYNFSSMKLNNKNRIEDKNLVGTFINDFQLMIPFFKRSNYMEVEGKKVVLIQNAADLFSNDNAALYQQLRSALSVEGFELFIVGAQPSWTPPARYDFRFRNGVDAVTHDSYIRIADAYYDRYAMFHPIVDQALTYTADKMQEYGLEYIPQVSPSYDGTIVKQNSKEYIIEKDLEWFKTYLNVAKRSATSKRMIIIDSFNDWNSDTQIEPAQTYGEGFLKLIRDQLKVN